MNNKITKIIDKNNPKASSKANGKLFIFFFLDVRQAESQN